MPNLLAGDKDATPFQAAVSAGSLFSPSFPASAAFDGDPNTRWASRVEANHRDWLRIDMGRVFAFGHLRILWERAMATAYDVRVSNDGQHWKTIAEIRDPDGHRQHVSKALSVDELDGFDAEARYLSIDCLKTGYYDLYSIWEIERESESLRSRSPLLGSFPP